MAYVVAGGRRGGRFAARTLSGAPCLGCNGQPRLGDGGFDWSSLATQLVNVGGSIASTALAPTPARPVVVAPSPAQLNSVLGSQTGVGAVPDWVYYAGGFALLLVLVVAMKR